MGPETNHQTNHQFRRLPKGERRVRFADSMGMELVSIFLIDLMRNYYFASIHSHKQLPPPRTIPKLTPSIQSKPTIINHTHNNNNNNNNLNTTASSPTRPTVTISRSSNLTTYTSFLNNNNLHSNNLSNCKTDIKRQSSTTVASNNDNISQLNNNSNNNQSANNYAASYICEFTQPISMISFKERVKLNKVHLETCSINSRAGNISVTCTIRVLNIAYDKSVLVRYTTDDWHTYTDCLASYKPGSNDSWSDRFTSTFSVTNQVKGFQNGQRIIFAIRYSFDNGDKVYWDNNGGLNYALKKV